MAGSELCRLVEQSTGDRNLRRCLTRSECPASEDALRSSAGEPQCSCSVADRLCSRLVTDRLWSCFVANQLLTLPRKFSGLVLDPPLYHGIERED